MTLQCLTQHAPDWRIPVMRTEGIRTLEIQRQALSPQPLMTRAGCAAARLALAIAPHARHIWIAAGPGNNGGDGLEAAAHLHRMGMSVHVSLLGEPHKLPPDARAAWERAKAAGVSISPNLLQSSEGWPQRMGAQDLCIDALLGIGARRAPSEAMQHWIALMNASAACVLALDLPTGLNADSGQPWGEETNMAVRADHTLTFLAAKPGLFMGQGRDLAGCIWLEPLSDDPTSYQPQAWLNPPGISHTKTHASHKGSHGDVAVVGGESLQLRGMGMRGAAMLAAQAALHAGAGRVMVCSPGDEAPASQPPDLMHRRFEQLDLTALTVVAGCGGGQAIAPWLPLVLQRSARLVLDADGLNHAAQDPLLAQWLKARQQNDQATVLTPHPLEAARLLGVSTQTVQGDRLAAATALSAQFQCTVALKGSGTVLASPGQTSRINTTGNGRLATGGTGDVLAGLVGARLAQGLSAWDAACSAVWQHGHTADQWPEDLALTASRLAERLR